MNKDILKELENYRLFAGLDETGLKRFQNVIKIREYEKGSSIIGEGEEGSFIFLLLEGEVEITQALTLSMNGDSSEEFDTREKAFTRLDHSQYPFIGEMSLFERSQKRSATVKALSGCRIGIISNEDLLNLCDKDPEIGYRIMKNIAYKLNSDLRQANQNVLKLTTALNLILE